MSDFTYFFWAGVNYNPTSKKQNNDHRYIYHVVSQRKCDYLDDIV